MYTSVEAGDRSRQLSGRGREHRRNRYRKGQADSSEQAQDSHPSTSQNAPGWQKTAVRL
jgi:hypothetical protein